MSFSQMLLGLPLFVALTFACDSSAAVNLIYINGIHNTPEDAVKVTNKIREVLDISSLHTGPRKRTFFVSLVWNPIGWYGTTDGDDLSQDRMEIFLLKTSEEDYRSDFIKILSPHDAPNSFDAAAVAAATRIKSGFLDDMTPGQNSLEAGGMISDDAMALTQKAAKSLATRVRTLKQATIVAHSEGNLLANLAFASLVSESGRQAGKMMRVVNVANTSEFSVNSLDLTHSGDAAVFQAAKPFAQWTSLETLPGAGHDWTRTTDLCSNAACDFTLNAPTFGFPDSLILYDPLQHGIVKTYLSTVSVPVIDTRGVNYTPGAKRFVDRFEDLVYTAAHSLEGRSAPQVAGSYDHTCATTPEGGVKCWGLSRLVGNGTSTGSLSPVQVLASSSGVIALAASATGTCAVTGDSRVKCWGDPLLVGTAEPAYSPVDISGLPGGALSVAVGVDYACVLLVTHKVMCWGNNEYGQLGNGNFGLSNGVPTEVSGLSDAVAIAAGWYHTCAITSTGAAKCWGIDNGGQLGDSKSIGQTDPRLLIPSATPQDVVGIDGGAVSITAGYARSCVVLDTGHVKCWGIEPFQSLPLQQAAEVPGLTDVLMVTSGQDGQCALSRSVGAMCWGATWFGELGDGKPITDVVAYQPTPTKVVGLDSGAVSLGRGLQHTCAVVGSKDIRCWGRNYAGQLGDGTLVDQSTPVAVLGF